MEELHKQKMLQHFPMEMTQKKVVILDIPDEYKYKDTELVEFLKVAVTPYL